MIGLFIISKSVVGFQTFAYFSDSVKFSGTITNGQWGCLIELDITNNTGHQINILEIVAGQDSHPKNNYIITPSNVSDNDLAIGETRTYIFEVDHREYVHCNIQWVYFDVFALTDNGDEYEKKQLREKVHNPPGKVKKDGYTTSFVDLIIDEKLLVKSSNKADKGIDKVQNTEEVNSANTDTVNESEESLSDSEEEMLDEKVNNSINEDDIQNDVSEEDEVENTEEDTERSEEENEEDTD